MKCPNCAATVELAPTSLVLVAPPAPPPTSTYSLVNSAGPDGIAPSALGGKVVSGSIYVVVTPEAGATQVRFVLDGTLVRTENIAPFALAGDVAGVLTGFDTTALTNGTHSLVAQVDHGGVTDTITAEFGVANIVLPYSRLLNVATAQQLIAAVAAALPGDKIVMADGTYNFGAVGSSLFVNRSGVQASPIQLVAANRRKAIIDFGSQTAFRMVDFQADWWVVNGLALTNSYYGMLMQNGHNNVIDDVESHDTGQCGFVIKGDRGSTDNTFRNCWIWNTGRQMYWYGEGMYVGAGAGPTSPSHRNRLLNNAFGPGVTADHVDVKSTVEDTYLEGNVADATGWRYADGSTTGGQVTESVFTNQGLRTIYKGNTVKNLAEARATGFFNWQGSGTRWHTNKCLGTAFKYGFATSGGTDNQVGCDNEVVGGAFSNVPCQ